MRRWLIIPLLALTLAGCGGGFSLPSFEQVRAVANIATASIDNPVTPERLNLIERSAIVIFRGLNAWRRACVAGDIPESCKDHIRSVQVYTKQIPPYLAQLRGFVRTNDKVNAMLVFNEIRELIGKARAKATEAGQTIPEVQS